MKKYVSTMIAGLAALAVAGSASATTTNVIHITGSTAFRAATMTAIGNILSPGYVCGFVGAGPLTKSSFAEYRGTVTASGNPVDIKVSWSGSVGGVQTLVQGLNVSTWLNSTNLAAGPVGQTVAATYDAAGPADITLSDSFQGSTAFTSPHLTDHIVGIVGFEWVRNVGCPSTFNNMTTLLAQICLGTGQIPFSQATGLNADENTLLTIIGRDEDSGTRLGCFAETGFGIFGAPFQYQPTISGTPGTGGVVTALAPWPVNTVNGLTYPVGHSGYSSGGLVATALGTPGSFANTGSYIVSYPGISDAGTAIGLGAAALNWNGVAYSTTAIEEGQYTFWTYEHLMYLPSAPVATTSFASTLATQIHDHDATVSGDLIGNMQVGRTVEGGDVTFGNPY